MDKLRTIEDFISMVDAPKAVNIIYGAGWAGQLACKFLKNKGIRIRAFAVTAQNRDWELDKIPVYCLDDILSKYHPDNINIILAVTKPNQGALEKELEKRGIENYIELSDALLYEITRENRKADAKEAERHKIKESAKTTVGYLSPGYADADYAEKRLIIDKIDNVLYIAMPKETAPIACIGTRYEEDLEAHIALVQACYCPKEYLPEVDLIHTFNMVCDTDRPWCASFETGMPRGVDFEAEKEYYLHLVECMMRPNCRALYALCKNAYNIQKYLLESHFPPDTVKLLMDKTRVLHPPQKILISEDEFDRKHNAQKLHFIFIGRCFFFKGGREMVEALSEYEDKYDFKLTLISSMMYDDYFTHTPYEEMVRCKEIIQEKSWIEYYESLPNEMVLEKCREATVGLLPSVGDTYGYVVLKMQAAGCPVITTDIRAFPEINNEECGWICRMPINELGFCKGREDTSGWSGVLVQELRRCLRDIFDNPDSVKRKGRMALERIRKMHDPYAYQKELQKELFSL